MQDQTTTPVEATAPEVVETKKPGRPPVEGSKRQQKLAERAEREAKGETIRRGRPAVEGSKRQQKLAARQARIEAGMEIKPGRPKMAPVEVPTTETVEPVATEAAVTE